MTWRDLILYHVLLPGLIGTIIGYIFSPLITDAHDAITDFIKYLRGK